MIRIQCPGCAHVLQVAPQYAGSQGRCKHCGAIITVPPATVPPQKPQPLLIAAIDFETTGLKAGQHEIIEVAGVLFDLWTGTVHDTFSELVKPDGRIPPRITQITGITNDDVRNARAIGQVIRDFAAWFDHATCLVAHNAPFDAAFLVSALDKHEINGCAPIIMDTLAWCRSRGLPTVNNKLQTLLEYIEAPMEGLHRAAADAHGAMFLMLYLAKTSPNIDDELAVYPMPIRDYAPGRARPTKPKSKAAKGNEIRIEFNLEDLVKDSTPTPRESESGTRPPEITIDTQAFAWRDEPASLKQGRFLESLGMDIESLPYDMTKGQASDMISQLTDNRIETTIAGEFEKPQESEKPRKDNSDVRILLLLILMVLALVCIIMGVILHEVSSSAEVAPPAEIAITAPAPTPEPTQVVTPPVAPVSPSEPTPLVYTLDRIYHTNKDCDGLDGLRGTASLESTAIRLRFRPCPVCVKN